MTIATAAESDLVSSTLAGDRQAFEEIVRRYQTLICSISYSGTGDVALSEDVAQETFLAAWRTMDQLRQPNHLKAWLCGIARRLSANRRRGLARAKPAVELQDNTPCTTADDPVEQIIGEEDRTLMWNVLSQLPEDYREPLILFYREEQSIRKVAENLDLSEEVVRQRLSRGRRLLSERVAEYVSEVLTRSKPGKTFMVAVMAAIPALSPQAVSAGVIATGGKGAILGKSAFMAGTLAAVWGPLIGLAGAWFGVRASLREAKSPEERRLMIQASWIIFGYIALLNLFIAAAYFLPHITSMTITLVILTILSLLYLLGFIRIVLWANRKRREIRRETGTEEIPDAGEPTVSTPDHPTGINMTGSLVGATCGSVAWIFIMSVLNNDLITMLAVAALSGGLLLISLLSAKRNPRRYYHITIGLTAALGLLNLAVVNLQWEIWMKVLVADPTFQVGMLPPLWALNLLLIGIFTIVLTSLAFKIRGEQHRN